SAREGYVLDLVALPDDGLERLLLRGDSLRGLDNRDAGNGERAQFLHGRLLDSGVWPIGEHDPARFGRAQLTRISRSAARGKKLAQQRRRLGLAEAAIDLRPVQASGGREIAHAAFDRAAFGIGGTVIEPPDAGE